MPETKPSLPIEVQVNAAEVRFGDWTLFESLDLTLAAGKWTCMLGASGVGKSTLLRLIAGLIAGDSVIGIACDDGRPLAGRAAYMAQQDLLLPWLSILDNVMLGARLRGGDTKSGPLRDRALELLSLVGLAANQGDIPAMLSGGMRQRAALARTLLEDRPVVLMDEPFSALDAITRIKLQELAAELLRAKTVLLVTHDPLEALRLGHRIHVMSGRPARLEDAMEFAGSPLRDLHDPAVLQGQADLLESLSGASLPKAGQEAPR
jgi:putative hydroxymethylpyrimidine transport system ATP-binding protein